MGSEVPKGGQAPVLATFPRGKLGLNGCRGHFESPLKDGKAPVERCQLDQG
jgi:hypothetical protein